MNTPWSAVVRVVALGVCAAASGADWVEQRTAHDRPGTYNGGLVVRVVDPWDEPVATTVWATGGGEAETDANGRAELQGVFTRNGLGVFVDGTDDLRPRDQHLRAFPTASSIWVWSGSSATSQSRACCWRGISTVVSGRDRIVQR